MNNLNLDSTIKDVQDLLEKEDELFVKQIKYLVGDDFKRETDKGYLARNFHFFMALMLQGVSSSKDKTGVISFLHIMYPDKNKTTYESDTTWRRNAGNFVNNEGNIDTNLNNKLSDIPETTKLEKFENGEWYDLKDSTGNPIFYTIDSNTKNKKSVFIDEKDNNGNIVQTGEARAKEKMKQIVDFLVNGVQITSNGGFSFMTDPYTLLLTNKQLIMNGAPGTGKTYSARNEIANKLFGIEGASDPDKEKIKNIQMDMVQFHPSYDYTDFIEGIRPNLSGQNVGYTLKNGSFKRFCRRAGVIERIIAAGKKVNANSINTFLEGEDEDIKKFWEEYIETNQNDIEIEKLPLFLFIIDEINRAEISKVLGEIMFCLDSDYRGPKGKIATQYASLATEKTFFIDKNNDRFFIPSNVYVIGTMNDIDRSVEVFDFALRRRFAWHEITADDVMDKVLKSMGIDQKLGQNYNDYLSRIKELNEMIVNKLKLNRHYHLGPSYFAKIELYMNGNYQSAREEVWNNHISQILNEYVKGKRTETEIENIGNNFKS